MLLRDHWPSNKFPGQLLLSADRNTVRKPTFPSSILKVWRFNPHSEAAQFNKFYPKCSGFPLPASSPRRLLLPEHFG